MNLCLRKPRCPATPCRSTKAFTLPEVMLSVAVMSVMFVSLYAGVSQGFSIVTTSREELRATQIILEKMEVLRLYTWDQVKARGYIPTEFTERFSPSSATNSTAVGGAIAAGDGTIFYGTITFGIAPVADAYTNDMRLITVTLNWTNNNLGHSRTMKTLVAEHGLQEFVY